MYDIVCARSKEMQAFASTAGFSKVFLITKNPQEVAEAFFIEKAAEYKKEIQKARKKFSLVVALGKGNTVENRKIIEACPDVLLSPHFSSRKDFMKERASGLDHILCKIAADNGVAIGIDFAEILNAGERERALLLGRIAQNIRLCRKYKCKMLLATFASSMLEMRSSQDLIAFSQTIGMTPTEAKNSLEEAGKILARNKEKKRPEYIDEGIRVLNDLS